MDKSRLGINYEYKEMIAEGGREMIAKGLTVGTWGNLSLIKKYRGHTTVL